MKKTTLFIILILLLASVLRVYKISSIPALNADEAALGYNAYSLLMTGKDEHGNSWPLHFQSFNDFKPGLYVYLALPFIKVFGLNELAVRLPGVSAGIASVYLVYLLVLELNKKLNKPSSTKHYSLALTAALLLAINPWHIHFSRGAWEVNVASFFILLGIVLYIKSGFTNLSILMLSAVSFALSMYAYHAARIIVPLMGVGLLLFNKNNLKTNIKNLLLAGLVGLVALTPLIRDFTGGEVLARSAGVGLFADVGPLMRINEQRGQHELFNSFSAQVLHNKAVTYGLEFAENWSEHYHGLFLFLSGDEIQRNRVPEIGQFYLWEVLTIFLGLIVIVRKKRSFGIILWWLIIAPIPAALTFQSPHALRAQNMVIPLTIISAIGLTETIRIVKNTRVSKLIKKFSFGVIFILLAFSFTYYLHMYYIHMPKAYPFSSQYGVKELVTYLNTRDQNVKNIVVTTRYDQPYILFLFYLNYPPSIFQEAHQLTSKDQYGFSTVESFDKYVFKPIGFDQDRVFYPNSLIAGTPEEIPDEANIVKRTYGSNNYEYFDIVQN